MAGPAFWTLQLVAAVITALAPVALLAHARFLGAHRALPTAETRHGRGASPADAAVPARERTPPFRLGSSRRRSMPRPMRSISAWPLSAMCSRPPTASGSCGISVGCGNWSGSGRNGFGTFKVSKRAARTGVNPQNPSEKIKIPAMKVAAFKAGKTLKEAVR